MMATSYELSGKTQAGGFWNSNIISSSTLNTYISYMMNKPVIDLTSET